MYSSSFLSCVVLCRQDLCDESVFVQRLQFCEFPCKSRVQTKPAYSWPLSNGIKGLIVSLIQRRLQSRYLIRDATNNDISLVCKYFSQHTFCNDSYSSPAYRASKDSLLYTLFYRWYEYTDLLVWILQWILYVISWNSAIILY
jgi:hypothetical protein